MPPGRGEKNVMPTMPRVVCDERKQLYFDVGEFLGKGGFAACYRLVDKVGTSYAAKVVGKHLIRTKSHSEKFQLAQEIKIHQKMDHKNIVKLYFAFEDTTNVYILLELCTRRSLMELLRRRKHVTEPEARYFVRHLTSACTYIHAHNIVHRDLKLGNLFLSDDMVLKVGDFGLATNLGDGMKDKNWLCGTPNYIAPEVLAKKPHTTKVDIWAIGCVLYALIVGVPPFETANLDKTYKKISQNDYTLPSTLSFEAQSLIKILLSPEPEGRPCATEIFDTPFMKGFTPKKLPISCLTTKPVFQNDRISPQIEHAYASQTQPTPTDLAMSNTEPSSPETYLTELKQQLNELLSKQLPERSLSDDDLKDPASVPVYWVSKWVDYSAKYGFAYQLCDGSFGTAFCDKSKLIMEANKEYCQYRSKDNLETFFSVTKCPKEYERKLALLQDFETYMTHNLAKTGASMSREGDEIARLPILQCWIRTKNSVNFLLSNGTYQCNFLSDHSKLIICPLMGAATLIDCNQAFHTYKLTTLLSNGAPTELIQRLHYAQNYIKKMMQVHERNMKHNKHNLTNTPVVSANNTVAGLEV